MQSKTAEQPLSFLHQCKVWSLVRQSKAYTGTIWYFGFGDFTLRPWICFGFVWCLRALAIESDMSHMTYKSMLDFCEQSRSVSEFCALSDLERNDGNIRHVALQLQTSWFCWGLDEIGDESCGSVDVEFELFLGDVGDLHLFCMVVSSS